MTQTLSDFLDIVLSLQKCPYGLYAEQLSGSAFTAPRYQGVITELGTWHFSRHQVASLSAICGLPIRKLQRDNLDWVNLPFSHLNTGDLAWCLVQLHGGTVLLQFWQHYRSPCDEATRKDYACPARSNITLVLQIKATRHSNCELALLHL